MLADSQFHSGETLGKALGVSRAAISNHIKVLTSLGLNIYSVTGKGYCLAQPLTMLNLEVIQKHLPDTYANPIEILNVTGSTNQYLKDKLPDLVNGHTCLAEAQTAGRGRHGRKWISPYGASLYLSTYWEFAGGYAALGGLSLAIGVAIVDALEACGINNVKLKWPNDIYAQGKKLAGVLIEVEGQIGSGCQTIVGVGLNVSLPSNIGEISQPWTDLTQLCETPINRNFLAANLLTELDRALRLFESSGLEAFITKWRQLDVFANQPIKLIIGQQIIFGISRGIDQSGAILVETPLGTRAYHGGEISVRSA
jgi:BirA family biotin operon repressor/biotin-[acetyl-CoA-carboxylase] ligase